MMRTPDGDIADGLWTVADAVEALARGEIVILIDSSDRENVGYLVIAAEHTTSTAINFMATHGRGLICAPMLKERLEALRIPPMTATNRDPRGTAFHVGVDSRNRITRGISASDRATTIRALVDPESTAAGFVQPGHVFPLAYQPGGVLVRAGHTEGAIDLVRMAGCRPAAVTCEIVGADGEMARAPDLLQLSRDHGLQSTSIADLIAVRRRTERIVTRVTEARLPLEHGDFRAVGYRDDHTGTEHIALVLGDAAESPDVLVRIHSGCLIGDVLRSRHCDCRRQLDFALRMIAAEGAGVVVYLCGHDERSIGLADTVHTHRLQDSGRDTVEANLGLGHPADRRDYDVGMQILQDLGIERLRLLTNNPSERLGLDEYGLMMTERVPLVTTHDKERHVSPGYRPRGSATDSSTMMPADAWSGQGVKDEEPVRTREGVP